MSRRQPAKPSTKSGSRAAAQSTEPARWQLRLPPGFFLFLAVTAFYVWTATSSQYAFKWGTRKIYHYKLLAEGFLSGHLYLAQTPPKEMLALKDPLDPVANGPYRLHDASLYEGRYYVYFGPVPALTLYLPWRAITGWGIPNNLAVIIYLLAGYLFSCLLLFLLLDAAGIRPSWILKRAAIAALGLCQTAPIILRRAYMYETAVAAGFCFLIAGMYFLARHALAEKPRMWHAVLAGLFLGMTPGCRPNYAVVAVLVIGGYLAYLWRSRRVSDRALLNQVFALGAAFAFCGLLLAWYNFARFGNPLETGQNYQLIGNIADRGITSKSSNFLPGLYRFLVEAPIWSRHFPFLELPTRGSFGATEWPAGTDYVEPIAGLLIISPLCIAGLLFPLYLRRWKSSIPDPVRMVLMLLYIAVVANLVTIVMVVNRVTQRYELDFAPALLIVALFVLLSLCARIKGPKLRRAADAATIFLVLASAGMQAGLSIDGYDNSLMQRNLADFNQLASFFGDDEMSVRRIVYGLNLHGQITFPKQAPGTREALLTTGVPGRSNAIFIEYLANYKIRLGYVTSGRHVVYGPEVPMQPQTGHQIDLVFAGGGARLRVLLDNSVALDEFAQIYPTSFNEATVGRNEIGQPPNVLPFSGDLKAPNGLGFGAATE